MCFSSGSVCRGASSEEERTLLTTQPKLAHREDAAEKFPHVPGMSEFRLPNLSNTWLRIRTAPPENERGTLWV